MTLSVPAIERFRDTFVGEIVLPGDGPYDDSRSVWNAVYDRRPALIARPSGATGVASAIRFAREQDLPLAVRCGGHTGESAIDGGLVVDLSRMRGVGVDLQLRRATVAGGSLLRDLDRAAQAHGLVCPVGVVGHTGVGGLTLGGGTGRLQRKFGLTLDNLRAVELVTADGRQVRASEKEEPELFWAMRGAGANFGVVTSFEYGLHPFGGTLHRRIAIYPIAEAREVWATFAAFAASAPDDVSASFVFGLAEPASDFPDEVGGRPIALIALSYSGEDGTMERDLRPLDRGPRPIVRDNVAVKYLEIQGANDDTRSWGRRNYINGHASNGFRPDVLDALLEHVSRVPSPECTVGISMLGGAIARVPADATAFPEREAPFDVSADAAWDDPALDEACLDWCHEAMTIASPDAAPGRYVGEVVDVGPEVTRSIYGDAILERLARVKAAWDPDNIFRSNHNVAPQA
jgi:FAD/FMN-containing dehydrogenase